MAQYFADPKVADECILDLAFVKSELISNLVEGNHPILTELLEKGEKIQETIATDVRKHGYGARVLRLTITPTNSPPLTVILKIPSVAMMQSEKFKDTHHPEDQNCDGTSLCPWCQEQQEKNERVPRSLSQHNTECLFYRHFFNTNVFPIPKVYFTQMCGLKGEDEHALMIMEDLFPSGFVQPFYETLSVEQVKSVAAHLARFHAHVISTSGEKDWPPIFSHFSLDFETTKGFGADSIQKVVQLDEQYFSAPLHRLHKTRGVAFAKYAAQGCVKDLGLPPVLLHGDFHSSNMAFFTSNPSELRAAFDFQGVCPGNLMLDLSRLMTLCCDADIRHQLETFILQHYLDHLKEAIAASGGGHLNLSIVQVQKAYCLGKSLSIGMLMIATSFLRWMWLEDESLEMSERERRGEVLMQRARVIVPEVVEMLEREAPEWLQD